MRILKSRWGKVASTLLVGAALAVATMGVAQAVVLETTGDIVLGAFINGDVGKAKINVEKATTGPDNNKHRLTATLWCDNSSGGAVNCGLIDGENVISNLNQDPQGPVGQHVVQSKSNYTDTLNAHSKPYTHAYECEGTTLAIYQSQMLNMFIVNRAGQGFSAPKDRETGWSALSGGCAP